MPFLKLGIITNKLLYIQKKIQIILKKRDFWPNSSLRLSCEKWKSSNYQAMINCKLYIKGK